MQVNKRKTIRFIAAVCCLIIGTASAAGAVSTSSRWLNLNGSVNGIFLLTYESAFSLLK